MPRVSVILPLYNGAADLPAALAGLDAQTFRDFELVVVDDASTDGTGALLDGLAEQRPGTVIERHTANRGVAAARNTAIALASGTFLWFIDGDDLFLPTALETLVTAAEGADADITVCPAVRARTADDPRPVPLDGERLAGSVDRRTAITDLLLGELRGYLWNKLVRRSLWQRHPFPDMRSQSDLAGIIGVLRSATTVHYTGGAPQYVHLVRANSITTRPNQNVGNLERCWAAGRDLAIESGLRPRDWRLVHYEYFQYLMPAVHTLLRTTDPGALPAGTMRGVRARIRVRDLVVLAPHRPALALKAAAYRVLGRGYIRVHRTGRRLRNTA